ncbi:MAG: segregation/condensation protein A [Clostridia bacterium]|nr:segregation/condensation protein A [Clostridia bacterium]
MVIDLTKELDEEVVITEDLPSDDDFLAELGEDAIVIGDDGVLSVADEGGAAEDFAAEALENAGEAVVTDGQDGALDDFERELAARRDRARGADEKARPDDKFRSMAEKFDSNVDYTTVLGNFEGPLDLLLHLINREEIEIKDIFVSQVTEQFLDYMKGLPYLDVDKVTEYLNIAATIIKIKAQSLVPSIDEMEDYYDGDIEDDKAQLIRALEEYRLIKEEMQKLKELETIGYYFKEPDKDVGETKTVFSLENLTLDGLVRAMSALLVKRENALEEGEIREIPRDEYTVRQKILFILEVFENHEEVRFEELFTKDFTKSEIVTTFQALLELLKHQYLHVRQAELFGQITIAFNPESPHHWVEQQIDEYE